MSKHEDESWGDSLIFVAFLSAFIPASGAFLGGLAGGFIGDTKKAVYQGAILGLVFAEAVGCNAEGESKKKFQMRIGSNTVEAQNYVSPKAPQAASYVSAQARLKV